MPLESVSEIIISTVFLYYHNGWANSYMKPVLLFMVVHEREMVWLDQVPTLTELEGQAGEKKATRSLNAEER